jgi:ribonuclease D
VTEQTGVAAKMIATVEDLEAIANDDLADVPALKGWRRIIFGEKALELKRGRLALAVENGKVVTFDWHDAAPEEAREPVSAETGAGSAAEATASG